MGTEQTQRAWQAVSADIRTDLRQWQRQHPRATLAEIETAVEARLAHLRATLLQEAVLASPATDWATASAADRPTCPTCQTPLVARGKQPRRLQAPGGHDVVLERTYGVCPTCGDGLFPPG